MSLLTEKYASVVASQTQSTAPILSSTKVSGAINTPSPRFVDSDSIEILSSDYIVIGTAYDNTYFALPDPTTCPGRSLTLRNNAGYAVYSTESNVALPGCGSPHGSISNILVYNDDQSQGWVDIVSDGEYWVIVRGYAQAYCD